MNAKQMKEFMKALDAIVEEKKIDKKIVVDAMEQAMAAAYKKNEGIPNVEAKVDEATGDIKLYSYKTVVEEPVNEETEISLEDARKIVDDIEIGETIRGNELPLKDFGRVAAGTAKQIVVQKIKEAEKQSISEEFKDKEGELMVGTLQREDQNNYFVDLGRSSGILPKDQIIPGEKLVMGSSVKVYVSKLEIGPKGPFIMLSRSHYGFVKRLLEIEIPELSDGTVMLYSVARDAGSRTKIAVYTDYANVEPLGAVIGEKGRRIASILKELGGEKIDVVLYDKDPAKFITNALSPAKNVKVTIKDESKKEALAVVPDDNLSLAIGRKGQNVKLASRLTHYKIEVKSESAMLEDEVVYTTKDDSGEESA
ncbi:MAG: transcription termination factor NusA [Bacilli bacterium]|nr:transcription termination factor NusA [Bacilli bacterium]